MLAHWVISGHFEVIFGKIYKNLIFKLDFSLDISIETNRSSKKYEIDIWPSVTLPISISLQSWQPFDCSTKMSNISFCFLFRSGISGIWMIHSDKH